MVLQGGQNLSGGQRSRIALARAVYTFPIERENFHQLKNVNRHSGPYDGTECFFLDDPCSSADPRVGSLVFSRLFGPDGLLQHGATVMCIDEPSLLFYLRMLRVKGCEPSVKFSIKIVDNGVLEDLPMSMFEKDLPALAPVRVSAITSPIELPDEPVDSQDLPMAAEQSYSGVVGRATYMWFGKRVGVILSLFMLIMVLLLCVTNISTQFW